MDGWSETANFFNCSTSVRFINKFLETEYIKKYTYEYFQTIVLTLYF